MRDTDGDGLPDQWEMAYGFDPQNPGDELLDPDADGLTNLQEYRAGTRPMIWDSDGDGASDLADFPDLDRDFDVDAADYAIGAGCMTGPLAPARGDLNTDGKVDGQDYFNWYPCLANPGLPAGAGCAPRDLDHDTDVDLMDFAAFQRMYTGLASFLPSTCGLVDFDADHDVDLVEFARLQRAFAP